MKHSGYLTILESEKGPLNADYADCRDEKQAFEEAAFEKNVKSLLTTWHLVVAVDADCLWGE